MLALVSWGKETLGGGGGGEETKVFECKTCGRRFSSFQALGGHRASHKKVKGTEPERARVHECTVCGLEFSVGQALGGHMRRHRTAATVAELQGKEAEQKKRLVGFDLNLPPVKVEEEERRPPMLLGFELIPCAMVDCFH
ncbi:hypothetical protein HPP92_003006 [Vanilla planifolia]|nr:hypothetical protein HPP92_003006 [Vanilla planifolia]